METYEIIVSIIIIAIILYFAFFYIQNINIESKKQESILLFHNKISDAKESLWSEGCINSTLYTITADELKELSKYKCSLPPCLIKNPYPIFIEIYTDSEKVEFGICPLDKSKCNINSFKIIINNSYIANTSLYFCFDDLSLLTATLQYNCNNNLSFKFDFSTKTLNILIKNNTVCVNNICNYIKCEKFLEDYYFDSAKSLYFLNEKGFYKVIKIS